MTHALIALVLVFGPALALHIFTIWTMRRIFS